MAQRTIYPVTTTQAAALLGWDSSMVRRFCADHDIGRLAGPRLRLLSADDIARLRKLKRDTPGKPRKNS